MASLDPLPLAWPPTDVAIAASLLSSDPLALLDETRALHDAGVDWLHVDIMDGHFVPNLGLTVRAVGELIARQTLPIDAHLMVQTPERYVAELAAAGASIITVHAEAHRDVGRVLEQIRGLGVRAGLALSPSTPIGVLEELADMLELVLIMSVHPGFCGQRFLPGSIDKLRRARALLRRRASQAVLAVDGGITTEHAQACVAAGAQIMVAGQALKGPHGRQQAVIQLRKAALQGL